MIGLNVIPNNPPVVAAVLTHMDRMNLFQQAGQPVQDRDQDAIWDFAGFRNRFDESQLLRIQTLHGILNG